MGMSAADELQIRVKVQMVVTDEDFFGVLTGERIAVALVFDRYDLLFKNAVASQHKKLFSV